MILRVLAALVALILAVSAGIILAVTAGPGPDGSPAHPFPTTTPNPGGWKR